MKFNDGSCQIVMTSGHAVTDFERLQRVAICANAFAGVDVNDIQSGALSRLVMAARGVHRDRMDTQSRVDLERALKPFENIKTN